MAGGCPWSRCLIHPPSPIRHPPCSSRSTPTAAARPPGIEALPYAREVVQRGAGEIILTSMDADGTKVGYDLEATGLIAAAVDVPVVASGGCGSPDHMIDVLKQTRADAVLAASIFHYGTYTIAETKRALAAAGLPVRPVTRGSGRRADGGYRVVNPGGIVAAVRRFRPGQFRAALDGSPATGEHVIPASRWRPPR